MSLHVKANAPATPLPNTAKYWLHVISDSFPSGTTNLRTKCVIVQNRSNMVSADRMALITFTATDTCDGSLTKFITKRAASIKIGFPGGCPISSLYPCEINSGQSQKLAVGSNVSK